MHTVPASTVQRSAHTGVGLAGAFGVALLPVIATALITAAFSLVGLVGG